MSSFDVVSLFTKIPIPRTLSYIRRRLNEDNEWKQLTSLTLEDVMSLITLCTKGNFFEWKNEFYKLEDGSPMGSPISPVLADFCLQELEEVLISENPHIQFYRRYVDDTFIIHETGKEVQIQQQLNSFDPNLKFTFESESHNQLPFLDILLIRNEQNILRRSVYRKPTFTGRYLQYSSYHHHSGPRPAQDLRSDRAGGRCCREADG